MPASMGADATPESAMPLAASSSPPRVTPALLWAMLLAGGVIMGLALGVRHVQGLFLLPVSMDRAGRAKPSPWPWRCRT